MCSNCLDQAQLTRQAQSVRENLFFSFEKYKGEISWGITSQLIKAFCFHFIATAIHLVSK